MLDQTTIDSLASAQLSAQQLFVNGEWVSSSNTDSIDVISPVDGRVITTISAANEKDVDDAVAAAKISFDQGVWANTDPAVRKNVLLKFADLVDAAAAELAVLGVRDNGTEISMAYKAEPKSCAATIRFYAESIDKIYGEIANTKSDVVGLIEREPVGVVGVIVPWNFPLMISAWKFAPALAVGNSVVIKPAETASLTLLKLAEIAVIAGIPAGVFNVITGYGHEAGRALALNNNVDVLAFTGSGVVGRKLLEYSARSNIKPVYLELGGKSPNIIFSDTADIEKAAKAAANGIFRNNGQVCVSGSRLLVERNIYEQVAERVSEYANEYQVGNPLSLHSDIGAINSAEQLDKNLTYVKSGAKQGAELLSGGDRLHEGSGGYYMSPAVFSNVTNDMKIARDEVFGPLLGIIPFDDEEHATAIANDSDYGLAAGVWTSNLARAHRMVKAIKAGVIHVNCYGGTNITVPMGGMKQSGNGYDKSIHALDKYSALKTAWMDIS